MSNYKGKKALVVGLGKTGQTAARFLADAGAIVTVTDQKAKTDLGDAVKYLADYDVDFDVGKINPKLFSETEMVVLSPGVPSTIEGLQEARNKAIPIINDIELLCENTKTPIIAVTGTNGKTTTTTLIAEMLKTAGKKVFTGGNIGTPALDYLLNKEQADYIVLEVSSFQCESLLNFKPSIAVFTNLEPNHLDRYPQGLDSYYSAKRSLLKNADADTLLITNLDNDAAAILTQTFPGKVFGFTKRNPISTNPAMAETFQGAYLGKPKLILKTNGSAEKALSLIMTKLAGDHNRENIMAAALAANAAGCPIEAIQKVIDTFKGVVHRLEFIRKKDGVFFYNDSKATSVPALQRALSSFMAPIILIAGGKDKDQDFAPLAEMVKKRVKNLILLGESKEKMNRFIGDYSETFLVGTFEEAILLAYQKSRNGDVILLSPGCASYDMFKNYEERGDYFKKLVAQL